MHILYEGICHLELSCLFNNLIVVNKFFTEVWLNKQIKNFKYYTVDIHDKPNGIDRKYYVRTENLSRDGYSSYQKFSQSSGQMSTLFQILPLLIGDIMTNNPNCNNFLR